MPIQKDKIISKVTYNGVEIPVDSNSTDEAVTITSNGTTTVPAGKRYSPITVNVSGKPEEARTVSLSMSSGNQVISPTSSGKVMTQVTVTKPATLSAENIKKNVNIGGIVGTYDNSVVEETLTKSLSMASGNQVIEPDIAGELIKKVTITKPNTLAANNIRKNINIGGVVGSIEGETITAALDMGDGNQTITPSSADGFIASATITKPATLTAGNIKSGVNIGGVVGTYAGTEVFENLNMANGNQVIQADASSLISSATIWKPATLVPGNIKKDVNIGGVVGTLETGGGGSGTVTWVQNKLSTKSTSISFTVAGHPIWFYMLCVTDVSSSSSSAKCICVNYDGSITEGMYLLSSKVRYSGDAYSFTYSDNTLTITSSSSSYGYMYNGLTYVLTYCY